VSAFDFGKYSGKGSSGSQQNRSDYDELDRRCHSSDYDELDARCHSSNLVLMSAPPSPGGGCFKVNNKPAGDNLLRVSFSSVKPRRSKRACSSADTVDNSVRTAQTEVSDPSIRSSLTHPPSSSRGCLKVKTQRESLSRIPFSPPARSQEPSGTAEDRLSVRFDTVEFREYARVLGDNPSTSVGPPVGIGWEYDQEIILDVDEYEVNNEGRRTKKEFAMDPITRGDMLREAGYSRREIRLATKMTKKERERRSASLRMQMFDPILERVDTVKCGVKRILPPRK